MTGALALPPLGHRIGLLRFHPAFGWDDALLAGAEPHRAGLLPRQPFGIRDLAAGAQHADLVAQPLCSLEVECLGGGWIAETEAAMLAA